MIEETGRVVSIRGDTADVETQRRSACGRCTADGTCGTSLIARHFGNRRTLVQVHNAIGAEPGELVVIGLPGNALLGAAFSAYLLPLLAMIGGAMFGAGMADVIDPAYEQAMSILGGLGGLTAALAWLPRLARSRHSGQDKRPRILRRTVVSGPVQTTSVQTSALPRRQNTGSRA